MDNKRLRIVFIMALALCLSVIVVGKMFYVQVLANEKYSYNALHNRLKEIDVTPNRGVIYDKNGSAMAVSVEKQSVWINAKALHQSKDREEIIKKLAEATGMKSEEVEKTIASEKEFIWLKRHLEDEQAEAVRQLNLLGVGLTPEFQREYPKDLLASHVLGFCGTDNQGLSGIELSANDILGGKAGKMVVEYDNAGRIIPQSMRQSRPARAGQNVYMTIDESIQYVTERELAKMLKTFEARNAIGIVMEVKTGKILAMATLPEFNPNKYSEYENSVWTNQAISRLYEPGSTFKTISGAMDLDDAVVTLNSNFYCGGSMKIDGHEFRCWSYEHGGNGAESFKRAIAMSCNVAIGQSALGLGMDRFYSYLDGYGMTQPTGIDLPGESAPLILEKGKAVRLDLAAMAIGQTNAYTPIQMIRGLCASVNGGHLLKPQIIDKITDTDGRLVKKTEPEEVRRVISEKTSQEMREALEYVVSDGLGKKAAVPGYRVGGKTGTGEIAEDGRYLKSQYIMSFAGFAPVEDPEVACIVIVDRPKTNGDSGSVCGPTFSAIMSEVLHYLEIPQSKEVAGNVRMQGKEMLTVPELTLPMNAEEARATLQSAGFTPVYASSGSTLVSYLPVAGTKVAKGTQVELFAMDEGQGSIVLPNLSGRTIKEAERILRGYGMLPVTNGSGLAYRQKPSPGSSVPIGDAVTVWFASSQERSAIQKARDEHAEKHTSETDAEEGHKHTKEQKAS